MEQQKKFTFVASSAPGLEELVFREVMGFGGEKVRKEPAVVMWRGTLESAYRACLWSRFASKVLLLIHTTTLGSQDDLYSWTKSINWSDHLDTKTTFAVSATLGRNPLINHSYYAALRVKDGVADFFRDIVGARPDVAKTRPQVKIHLHIQENQASLYIDLSGDSLHRRGYRDATGIAPLKETLAAAIVSLSGWSKKVVAGATFLDPMCGSGTLLIEAALLWGDSAPGLSRKYYGFHGWLGHDDRCWSELVEEAICREEEALDKPWPKFIGYDCDPEVVAVARNNIERAGLEDKIKVRFREFGRLEPPDNKGFLVTNLPYGERLSEKSLVAQLYRCVGRTLQRLFSGWYAGLFVAEPDLADKLSLQKCKSLKLYNGAISCRLITGEVIGDIAPAFIWKTKKPELEIGQDFINRLQKNYKRVGGWAKKRNISCYRLYDRDLPDYNVCIDVYNRWILVQEFMPPANIDSELAQKRLSLILRGTREFFQVGRDRVFIKRRQRQRGKGQYQKKDVKPKYYEVCEGRCWFLVNFVNYLDTGLFLDHRPIRERIAEQASGKRFLNLFGYTGTATVHAAMGGAARTTTVDLSSTYLEWTAKNLALNGFSSGLHELVNQDCMSWLKNQNNTYDLIFIDPPTFSNTKKKDLVFDVQKNHAELLEDAAQFLDKDGSIFFSSNYKGFKLDSGLEHIFRIRNISRDTIPFDFERNASVHKCWEMKLL